MAFVPNTDTERQEMLNKIGVNSFDELIAKIPENVRFKGDLDILPQLSEYEVVKLLNTYANKNVTADQNINFMGGGAYDHFIPSVVGTIMDRSEFKTAYTPYQAEVSQGTLQAMYEFQSLIAEITGMDVANASMYDAGTAVAEACHMAHAQTRKKEFLVAGKLNPNYTMVMHTSCAGREFTFKEFVAEDGSADIEALKAAISENTAGVIVQQPNAYGVIENVKAIEEVVHETKAMFIVCVNPMSLGILEAPGNYNADIVVGEGQVFGIPVGFGGPYLGLFACKQKYVRKIPGRLAGMTKDSEGKRGFVLTLQTREQQIKREKATSNICTNQGLFMLAATVYLETMGKQGIKEVAEQSFQRAHYLANRITELNGFKLAFDKPFFNEFLLETPVPAKEIISKGVDKGFLPGLDTTRFEGCKEGLLVAVTEKRSKEEMDQFVEFLSGFAK